MPSSAPPPKRQSVWHKLITWLGLPTPATCDGISQLGLKYSGSTSWEKGKVRALITWQLLPSLACSGILLAAITLGLKREQWPLTPTTIGSIEVDPDLQLIILGVVNKSLDVVVQAVLEHLARFYNTLWMLQPGVGATMQDTLIKNEMAKPWAAIRAYWRRHHAAGWIGYGTISRLIVTLAISTSVMLLGAGLNTIGWPKKRWYPDHGRAMNLTEQLDDRYTIHTPLVSLERVDWAEDMRAGLSLVGGVPQLDEYGKPVLTGGAADEIAGAIAASMAFFALTRLPGMYARSPADWLSVWDTPAYITGMQTQINGSTVQSISVQAQRIVELFEYHKDHGKTFARTATGFHGIVQIAVPRLVTICSDPVANGPPDNGLDIHTPDDNSASFSVLVGPSAGLSFAGASCTLTLSQVLVPVETWIVDMQPSPWMSISNIAAPASPSALPIATTAPANALMTSRLATHFKSMLPMLHGQVPSFGVVPHLAMAARMLQAQRPDFPSDAAALSAVVATLAQQQLSTASWTLRVHEDELVSSAPVHWQLYGSGPRMKWEWIAMLVLTILLLVMLNHIGLLLVYRIQTGAWLELGGMLRTAYRTSRPLPSVERVHAKGSLGAREDVTKNADDMVRYEVVAVDDQWPEFVEVPMKQEWATKKRRRAKHKHAQSTVQATVQTPMQTRPADDSNTSGVTVVGIPSSTASTFVSASPSQNTLSAGASRLPSAAAPSVVSTTPLLAVPSTQGASNASMSSLDSAEPVLSTPDS